MKILQISDKLHGFGTPTVFRLTVEALKAHHDVYIAASHLEEGPNRLVLKSWESPKSIITRTLNFFYLASNHRRLYSFLKRHQIECIHLHSYQKDLSPSILRAISRYKKKNNTLVIQSLHDYHWICPNNSLYCYSKEKACQECLTQGSQAIIKNRCDYRGVFHTWLRYARYLLCTKLFLQHQWVDRRIVPSKFSQQLHEKAGYTCDWISNPVDTRFLSYASSLQEKENRLVYFGRLSAEKNITLLLQAFARMKYRESYTLDIIGSGSLESQLKEEVEVLNIASRVRFITRLSPEMLAQTISRAKLSILPSKCYETFGLTTVESIYLKVVPLVSQGGALEEVVKQCGLTTFFDASRVESLVALLENCLENYDTYYAQLEESRENVIDVFSPQRYCEAIERCYQELRRV